MEELTESARQCLVSQGIVTGSLSVLNSLSLLLTGIIVLSRAADILQFTGLSYLAILQIVCGVTSVSAVIYVWWTVAAYRNRQLEVRAKYLDEHMSKGLIGLLFSLFISFSASIVSAIFLLLKTNTSSIYDLKSAMSFYASDITRKVIIDKLQILFECCGSLSLLDWFLVDWQNADLEPGNHLENITFTDWDSVPYSCCNPEAPPPCVHHQLRAFGVGSIYTSGCADKLDEAVFVFVIMALLLHFAATFLLIILVYSARKLQTSARSAVEKGDATAPGSWWLLTPAGSIREYNVSEVSPLITKSQEKLLKRKCSKCPKPTPTQVCCCTKDIAKLPFPKNAKASKSRRTENEDWETFKTESKDIDGDSSEDWTRRANNPSASTSTTSFLTTTRPCNSTPESRHSVSDTAVANLEVSHHFEHKIRPLYRS